MRACIPAALVLTLALPAASADTLSIRLPDDPPNSPEGVPRPVRGMTMATVVERFGEPGKRLPAVGEPPITRWVYDRFTVYFEGELTLRSVVHRE